MTFATDIFDGDGSQTEFELTFDYIERDHVKVYRVAADESETQLTVVTDGSALGDDDYKWETDKKVKLGKAPASTEKCKVVRETPQDRQLVQWKDGSYIVAEDLNTSDKQFLYVEQEHDDRIETLEGFVPTVEKAAITESEAEKDPDDPAWSGDERIATVGAIDRIYSNVVGSGSSYPGTGNKGKLGKLRLDNTTTPAKMFWWDASLATPAWVELKVEGKKGDPGPAPGLQDPATEVSNVDNKADGSVGDATVSIEQDATSKDLKFTFGIPVGKAGRDGTGAGTVTNVKGGSGITSDGKSDEPTLSVDYGEGLEPSAAGVDGKARVKLDGTTITRGAAGIKVTTPFENPPNDSKTYGRKTTDDGSSWVEVTGGGSGTLTGVAGGAGISVDTTTPATPKVSVDHDATLEFSGSGDSRQLKVKTPFVEPTGDDANYVRKKDGTTFTWEKESTSSGVPEPTSDGTFSRKKDGASLSWVAAEGFADVSTDGSFVRTRSGGSNSWTAAPAASPWTRTPGTPNIISPAVAADQVNALGGLLTKQVWAAAVSLSGATVTPDFKEGNCFILSGAITTVNAPSNLKVGQSGKFYFLSGATVAGWNTNYKWPGGTKALAPTGLTIVPFYVATTSIILMGASTEDIK